MKQRKEQKHQGEKRQLTLSSNNELQCSRKRYRGDEIVMSSTSGYNLRPRRGAKVESPDQPMRRGHNKEGQFESEEAENISTAPESKSKQGLQVRRPEAEVVNNSIARRGEGEQTRDGPNLWRF
ncbi:hypothetical protein TNCV_3270541 [Trichonephila clavipes]|nr:hypothetical protein TNCV_3270541 [Trichonephila clavipes]